MALAAILSLGSPLVANDQFALPGMPPNHFLQTSGFDRIDILNGSLHFSQSLYSAQIDSGFTYSLTLAYNSNVWEKDASVTAGGGEKAKIAQQGPVGVGFKLHLGRIYEINGCTANGCPHYYEEPDGTTHRLFSQSIGGPNYYFTHDTSNLRAKQLLDGNNDTVGWLLWRPDGTLYEMRHKVTLGDPGRSNYKGWYTTLIRSPLEPTHNYVTVGYDVTYPLCIAEILDTVGRLITFNNLGSIGGVSVPGGYTASVDFPAFGNHIATYTFNYILADVTRPFGSVRVEAQQLLLTSVTLPMGGYSFQFGYADPATGSIEGAVRTVTQPAGAHFAYDYATLGYLRIYSTFHPGCQPGDCLPIIESDSVRQVVTKTLTAPAVASTAVWHFARSSIDPNQVNYHAPVVIRVTDPYGNVTRHLSYSTKQNEFPTWNDGLVYRTEFYHGPEDSQNLIRATETDYDYDQNPQAEDIDEVQGWDIREKRTRTTYNDDLGQVALVEDANWDGYHWRDKTEYMFSGLAYRTSVTAFTVPAVGAPLWDNWILNTYTSRRTLDAASAVVQESDYTFGNDGRLLTRRDLVAPPALSAAGDVVTSQAYDTSGNVTSIEVKASDPTCQAPSYTTADNHVRGSLTSFSYQVGYLSTEQVAGVSWKSIDRAIDLWTGLAAISRDPAGVATTYNYDLLGRVASITPTTPERATTFSYPNLLESTAARGVAAGSGYMLDRSCFDSLGRLTKTQKRDENNNRVRQVQTYVGSLDRVASRSEWVSDPSSDASPCPASDPNELLPQSSFSYSFPLVGAPGTSVDDPFGRVQRVTKADGQYSTTSYYGVTKQECTFGINNVSGQEACSTDEQDAVGRLVSVMQSDLVARAAYGYDPLDRLTTVTATQSTKVQTRSRSYDGLGRMRVQDDPETRPHATLLADFDPRGNALSVTQPDNSVVRRFYDPAGRLLRTQLLPQGVGGATVVTSERTYDEVSGGALSSGKLTTQKSYDDAGALVATRAYSYLGLNGRLGGETTSFPEWIRGGSPAQISTQYAYDTFGHVQTLTYPVDGGTVLTNTFAHDRLVSIADNTRGTLVSNMSWTAAGGRKSVTTANGVDTSYPPDMMNRPSQVLVKRGSTPYLDTGSYVYDGAGNITHMGADSYVYDAYGRLTSATDSANGYANQVYFLSFVYDPFGNMTNTSKTYGQTTDSHSFPTDPNTNRMQSMDGVPIFYDANGNLLNDDVRSFLWDRRSRMQMVRQVGTSLGEYEYDSTGYRVRRDDSGAHRRTYYFRDGSGKLLSEYSKPTESTLEPQWSRDYVYAASDLVAIVRNSAPIEPAWLDSSASPSGIHLSWVANSETDLFGYNVYKMTSSGSGYVRANTSTLVGTSFDDPNMLFSPPGVGVSTHYVLVAVDTAGNESRYSVDRVITPGDTNAPAVPTGLAASGENGWASLTWSPNSEVDQAGYNVFRSQTSASAGGVFTKINAHPVATQSYSDLGLPNGTTFYYKIAAVDTAGNPSNQCAEVSATPSDGTGGGGGGNGGCEPHCMPGISEFRFNVPCDFRTGGCASEPRFVGTGGPGWEIDYIHTDHLGSVRVVTDPNGLVVSKHHYFPFGDEIPPIDVGLSTKKFTGHEHDSESGLDYMLARYYSSRSGRFMSSDPLSLHSQRLTTPQSLNLYIYVLNSPVSYSDPTGLESSVFIVTGGNGPKEQQFGHAALFTSTPGFEGGISYGGHYGFEHGSAGFVSNYTGRGSTVTEYKLNLTPEQEAKLAAFVKHNSDGQVDGSAFGHNWMISQNCTTACGNALEASGAVPDNSNPGRNMFGFDTPSTLAADLGPGGRFNGLVLEVVTHPPDAKAQDKPTEPTGAATNEPRTRQKL